MMTYRISSAINNARTQEDVNRSQRLGRSELADELRAASGKKIPA